MKLKQNSFGKKPCVRRGRIDYYQPHFGDVPELRKVVTNSTRNGSFFKQIENRSDEFTSGTTNRTLGTSPNYCKERAICPLLRQCFFSRLEFTNACHWSLFGSNEAKNFRAADLQTKQNPYWSKAKILKLQICKPKFFTYWSKAKILKLQICQQKILTDLKQKFLSSKSVSKKLFLTDLKQKIWSCRSVSKKNFPHWSKAKIFELQICKQKQFPTDLKQKFLSSRSRSKKNPYWSKQTCLSYRSVSKKFSLLMESKKFL